MAASKYIVDRAAIIFLRRLFSLLLAAMFTFVVGCEKQAIPTLEKTAEHESDVELPPDVSPIPDAEEQAFTALLTWTGNKNERGDSFSFNEAGRVVSVDLSKIPGTDNDSLALVAAFSELEELCAASPEISDEGLRHIVGLKHLERLDLEGAAVTDSGIEMLKQLESLRDISIKRCGVTDQAFAYFAEMKNLTRIRAVRTYVTNEGLTYLKDKTNLELLDFRNCTLLSDQGLEHLRGLSNLRDLKVWGPGITNTGVEYLSSLQSLRILSLQDCSIDDAGIEQLTEMTSLEDLTLFRLFISDEGLRHVGQLTNLKRLSLRANVVGSEGLAHLTMLQSLEYLDLSETIVEDEGLAHLKPLSHLTELNLWATRIGDDGMTYLAELQSLQRLNLENVGYPSGGVALTSEGVKQLASLPNLEWLSLNKTQVDDNGVIALGALPKLTALEITDCPNITSEGIERLQTARPNLNIQH